MARVSTEAFLARLAKGKPAPVLLLLGEERYLRDICRTALVATIPEAARDWAVSRYSADRGETRTALEQAQTLPMLSSQQVVFLEDVERIEKLGDKNRETAIDNLEAYLKNPAPFTVLVLEATLLDQRMKLAKLLADMTLVVEVGLGDDPDRRQQAAATFARAIAKEKEVEWEPGAAEDLAEFVAADLMRLKTEIEKLAVYVGDKRLIRRRDVSALVVSEKTTTSWELAEMLASRQQNTALDFLDRLLRDGEEPVLILGAITWTYRKLIEASDLKGVTNGYQAARALGMNAHRAEMALRNARKISKPRLLQGLQFLKEADSRLKGGAEDARTVLEFLITQLCGLSATSRSAAR